MSRRRLCGGQKRRKTDLKTSRAHGKGGGEKRGDSMDQRLNVLVFVFRAARIWLCTDSSFCKLSRP